MKKLLALLLVTVLLFALSGCANNADNTNKNSVPQNTPSNGLSNIPPAPSKPSSSEAKITKDKAIEIALEKAKLKKADVLDLEAELYYENGVLVWELEFDYKNFDYSYDIDANTGAIVFEVIEKDYK